MTMPKIKEIKIDNPIIGELDVVAIPLTEMGSANIQKYIKDIKKEINTSYNEDVIDMKNKLIRENNDEEELKEMYLKNKITIKLAELGKETTDEEYEKQKKRFADKYLKDKTVDDIIDELSSLTVDMQMQNEIILATLRASLFEILREPENRRNKIFKNINELRDTFSQEEMIDLMKLYGEDNDPDEEEIKK